MADGSSVAILERLSSERSVKRKIFRNIRNNFPILTMGLSGIPATPENPGWTSVQPGSLMVSEFHLLPVVFSRLAFQIPSTACPENQSRPAGADIKNAVRVLDGVGLLRGCGFEALSVNRTTLFQKAVIKGRCYNKPYRSISVRAILSFLNGRTSIPPRFAKAVCALRETRAEMSRHSGVLRR